MTADLTASGVTIEALDLHAAAATGTACWGGAEAPAPAEVWVVLLQCERMGEVGLVHEVLSADPGPDYGARLVEALALTRQPLASSTYVEVVRRPLLAPPVIR